MQMFIWRQYQGSYPVWSHLTYNEAVLVSCIFGLLVPHYWTAIYYICIYAWRSLIEAVMDFDSHEIENWVHVESQNITRTKILLRILLWCFSPRVLEWKVCVCWQNLRMKFYFEIFWSLVIGLKLINRPAMLMDLSTSGVVQ